MIEATLTPGHDEPGDRLEIVRRPRPEVAKDWIGDEGEGQDVESVLRLRALDRADFDGGERQDLGHESMQSRGRELGQTIHHRLARPAGSPERKKPEKVPPLSDQEGFGARAADQNGFAAGPAQ